VLGARVGGIPETLEDGVSGWLFEPGCEPDALAEAIAAIRALPLERREAARARARADAARRFGHLRFVEAYREIFAELAEQRLPVPARRNQAAT
jgi:glycosyltransferase involved in cell wall biosynthesis